MATCHHCPIEDSIKDRGLRRTDGRHRLLELLEEKRAWTVRELHDRLGQADLTTVYRNIRKLVGKGIISEVLLRGAEARYELAERPHHAHRVCPRCRRADCVPCPLKTPAEHHLELGGVCTDCRRPL